MMLWQQAWEAPSSVAVAVSSELLLPMAVVLVALVAGWRSKAASADALAVPGGGVGGGGGWLAPEAAPGGATRNPNLCLPWRFVLPV